MAQTNPACREAAGDCQPTGACPDRRAARCNQRRDRVRSPPLPQRTRIRRRTRRDDPASKRPRLHHCAACLKPSLNQRPGQRPHAKNLASSNKGTRLPRNALPQTAGTKEDWERLDERSLLKEKDECLSHLGTNPTFVRTLCSAQRRIALSGRLATWSEPAHPEG